MPFKLVKLGNPVERVPIMNKQLLDLYNLYKYVKDLGGSTEVSCNCNQQKWDHLMKKFKIILVNSGNGEKVVEQSCYQYGIGMFRYDC